MAWVYGNTPTGQEVREGRVLCEAMYALNEREQMAGIAKTAWTAFGADPAVDALAGQVIAVSGDHYIGEMRTAIAGLIGQYSVTVKQGDDYWAGFSYVNGTDTEYTLSTLRMEALGYDSWTSCTAGDDINDVTPISEILKCVEKLDTLKRSWGETDCYYWYQVGQGGVGCCVSRAQSVGHIWGLGGLGMIAGIATYDEGYSWLFAQYGQYESFLTTNLSPLVYSGGAILEHFFIYYKRVPGFAELNTMTTDPYFRCISLAQYNASKTTGDASPGQGALVGTIIDAKNAAWNDFVLEELGTPANVNASYFETIPDDLPCPPECVANTARTHLSFQFDAVPDCIITISDLSAVWTYN